MIITDIEKLRQKCKDFKGTEEELQSIITELEKELANSKIPGCGLSAIQIDKPIKVCIIRTIGLNLNLYNAEIIEKQQPFIFKGEGCLSLPEIYANTHRFNIITLRNGDGSIVKYSGFDAVVIQHELDHFNSLIFTDYKTT